MKRIWILAILLFLFGLKANAQNSGKLRAAATAHSVTLTWKNPVPPAGCAISLNSIYKGTASGNETLLTSTTGPATTYTDTQVSAGQTIFYYVTATGAFTVTPPPANCGGTNTNSTTGQSVPSNEVEAIIPSAPPPTLSVPAVTVNIMVKGTVYMTASWTSPSPFTSYFIYSPTQVVTSGYLASSAGSYSMNWTGKTGKIYTAAITVCDLTLAVCTTALLPQP